jgi:hypothetical protein
MPAARCVFRAPAGECRMFLRLLQTGRPRHFGQLSIVWDRLHSTVLYRELAAAPIFAMKPLAGRFPLRLVSGSAVRRGEQTLCSPTLRHTSVPASVHNGCCNATSYLFSSCGDCTSWRYPSLAGWATKDMAPLPALRVASGRCPNARAAAYLQTLASAAWGCTAGGRMEHYWAPVACHRRATALRYSLGCAAVRAGGRRGRA